MSLLNWYYLETHLSTIWALEFYCYDEKLTVPPSQITQENTILCRIKVFLSSFLWGKVRGQQSARFSFVLLTTIYYRHAQSKWTCCGFFVHARSE